MFYLNPARVNALNIDYNSGPFKNTIKDQIQLTFPSHVDHNSLWHIPEAKLADVELSERDEYGHPFFDVGILFDGSNDNSDLYRNVAAHYEVVTFAYNARYVEPSTGQKGAYVAALFQGTWRGSPAYAALNKNGELQEEFTAPPFNPLLQEGLPLIHKKPLFRVVYEKPEYVFEEGLLIDTKGFYNKNNNIGAYRSSQLSGHISESAGNFLSTSSFKYASQGFFIQGFDDGDESGTFNYAGVYEIKDGAWGFDIRSLHIAKKLFRETNSISEEMEIATLFPIPASSISGIHIFKDQVNIDNYRGEYSKDELWTFLSNTSYINTAGNELELVNISPYNNLFRGPYNQLYDVVYQKPNIDIRRSFLGQKIYKLYEELAVPVERDGLAVNSPGRVADVFLTQINGTLAKVAEHHDLDPLPSEITDIKGVPFSAGRLLVDFALRNFPQSSDFGVDDIGNIWHVNMGSALQETDKPFSQLGDDEIQKLVDSNIGALPVDEHDAVIRLMERNFSQVYSHARDDVREHLNDDGVFKKEFISRLDSINKGIQKGGAIFKAIKLRMEDNANGYSRYSSLFD